MYSITGAGTTNVFTVIGLEQVTVGAGATSSIKTDGTGGSKRLVMSVITGAGATCSITGAENRAGSSSPSDMLKNVARVAT